jgi:NAD(P)-dependent dehydrogenase (short-subunit alcohol dehydrogenase family)
MLETNVLGLLVGCQAAVRAMRACKAEGHVVNISSIAAQRSDSGVYGATKHAVNAISATLRGELEEDSIRVVNVMPGAIATNFARNFDPAFLEGFVKMSGVDVEIKPGEKLPGVREDPGADAAAPRRAPGRGRRRALRGDAPDPRQHRGHHGAPAEAAESVGYASTWIPR